MEHEQETEPAGNCAAKLPAFTLSADDPFAPSIALLWVCFREGDMATAIARFAEAAELAAELLVSGIVVDDDELERTARLAEAMEACRRREPWCRSCYCTEGHGCEGGCTWSNAEQTLCTACAEGGAS